MRLIDADALEYHKQLECMGNGQYEDVKVVYEWEIDTAPTIDAEPVVRCKDCKHNEGGTCGYSEFNIEVDDYCSFGERREP